MRPEWTERVWLAALDDFRNGLSGRRDRCKL